MSSLILPHSRFVHVPKTGGTWISAVLPAAGVPVDVCRSHTSPLAWGNFASQHVPWDRLPYPDRFTFAFVRHPVSWWHSYWAHRSHHGWTSLPYDDLRTSDFCRYLDWIVTTHPGAYSLLVRELIGEAGDTQHVGKFEDLPASLYDALHAAGETIDEDIAAAVPSQNVTPRKPCNLPVELCRRVESAESEVMARFGYDSLVDADAEASGVVMLPGSPGGGDLYQHAGWLAKELQDKNNWHWKTAYKLILQSRSDIRDHIPRLRQLAQGNSVVELGVRYGVSTIALLAGRPTALHSYDLYARSTIPALKHIASTAKVPWQFHHNDVRLADVPECDVILFDADHSYRACLNTLRRHAPSARERIAIHDTNSLQASQRESAISVLSFLAESSGKWCVERMDLGSNGLTVLKRTTQRD